jgi:serine-type D-Ala-D-Ala carboxypeptidase (penicillin-binding protein 5/6)
VRLIAALALVAGLTAALTGPPPTTPAARPVVHAAGCPEQQVPPAPAADEELVGPAPAPLPWPSEPLGGPGLSACDQVGPAGAPEVSAASWVLADLDTGAVLAARAPHARHRPASTLKVLTALVALRRLDPDAVVAGTAEDQAIEGSKAGIGPGGQYTVRQLLAGLLLNSGNDTAQALARAMGGVPVTLAAMTDLAHELGAWDTRPATPSGLDGPGMAASAYDLALLFRVAMREPLFAETIRTRSIPFPGYGQYPGFELTNGNTIFTRYPGSLGAKTGFTDASRHTLVAAAERGGRRLVVALMRGEQRPVPMWKQGADLLDWGFALPPETPSVGVLVDSAPPPPAPAPVDSPVLAPVATPATAMPLPVGFGLIAVAGLVIGRFALRRRRRPARSQEPARNSNSGL